VSPVFFRAGKKLKKSQCEPLRLPTRPTTIRNGRQPVSPQQDSAAVSTSIFLPAGLGLASGYCAGEALAQIESVAKRIGVPRYVTG
jgi:hypothetical protein